MVAVAVERLRFCVLRRVRVFEGDRELDDDGAETVGSSERIEPGLGLIHVLLRVMYGCR